MIRKRPDDRYNPLFFLAALGAGGAAVTFHVYLNFLVAHPDTPVVTIDQLWPLLRHGDPLGGAFGGLALIAMLSFTLLHLRLLAWNLGELWRFRRTEAFRALRTSHGETSLLAVPLTLAMTVNVLFLAALAVLPELWRQIETLLPLVLVAFLAIGGQALFLYGRILARLLRSGTLDTLADHSLGHMIAVFAFAMVAMGLAAPGCMSQHTSAGLIGTYGALLFAAIAGVLGLVLGVLGLRAAGRSGIGVSVSPGVWIAIPVLTLLGIVAIRLRLGPLQGFDAALLDSGLFALAAIILVLQLLVGVAGYRFLRRLGYFRDYLHGDHRHPGAYALICPGIALFVFGMYFVAYGLVGTGLLDSHSPAHFAVLLPLALLQIKTLATLLRLNGRLLGSPLAV